MDERIREDFGACFADRDPESAGQRGQNRSAVDGRIITRRDDLERADDLEGERVLQQLVQALFGTEGQLAVFQSDEESGALIRDPELRRGTAGDRGGQRHSRVVTQLDTSG